MMKKKMMSHWDRGGHRHPKLPNSKPIVIVIVIAIEHLLDFLLKHSAEHTHLYRNNETKKFKNLFLISIFKRLPGPPDG